MLSPRTHRLIADARSGSFTPEMRHIVSRWAGAGSSGVDASLDWHAVGPLLAAWSALKEEVGACLLVHHTMGSGWAAMADAYGDLGELALCACVQRARVVVVCGPLAVAEALSEAGMSPGVQYLHITPQSGRVDRLTLRRLVDAVEKHFFIQRLVR